MMDRLGQFFGQNPSRQQEYQDFAQRYQQDPNSISDEEAAQRYREMMAHADPQTLEQAHAQAFSQLPDQDRYQMAQHFHQATQDPNIPYQGYPQGMDLNSAAHPQQLAQMAAQAHQQSPDLMGQLVGPNSPLASTGAKLAMAGAAAFLASRYLGQRQQ